MTNEYRILYINENGADFHTIGFDESPEETVRALRIELSDDPDEVTAYLVGVRLGLPWYVEPVEVT